MHRGTTAHQPAPSTSRSILWIIVDQKILDTRNNGDPKFQRVNSDEVRACSGLRIFVASENRSHQNSKTTGTTIAKLRVLITCDSGGRLRHHKNRNPIHTAMIGPTNVVIFTTAPSDPSTAPHQSRIL